MVGTQQGDAKFLSNFIKSVSDKRVINMHAICNDLYIQEVKAAESLDLDIDMWEHPTNAETALSIHWQ